MHNDPSSLILQYLSTAGKSLEKIKSFGSGGFFSSDLLRFIGTSCPNLEELSWFHGGVHSVEENLKPIEIYQLCPKFKFIGYNIFKIMNDGKNRSRLCFELCNTGWENGIECVLLSLQRGKYTQVKLNVYPLVVDWNLVTSNLGSLVTSLMLEETSEDVLISLLPDLPRLQELDVKPSHAFTDKILPVIAEHGQKLIKLCLTARNDSSEFNFTEEMTCQMISKCNMLEVLEISRVGCESILYAAYHLLRLRKVKFHHPKSSKEDIVSLFRGEEVEWSSYLREGKIGGVLKYDQSSRSWVDEIHTNTGMHW
eukprot:scaffold15019_cov288-Ochromonas_danica.AAC.1